MEAQAAHNQVSPGLLGLMRLVSPALPVGAYSYSQGLEMAIEKQWLVDESSTGAWLSGVMQQGLQNLDVPLLRNLYQALQQQDESTLLYWNSQVLAFRESRELRLEELQMGKALWRLLSDLHTPNLPAVKNPSWLLAFAVAAHHWQISLLELCYGYVWSWLENQLAAAAKLVPLGQTQIQRLTAKLMPCIAEVVTKGCAVNDDELGVGMPGLVMASMHHEQQYSRLFRS